MATLASNQVEMLVEAHDTISGKLIFNNLHFLKTVPGLPAATKADLLLAFRSLWRSFIVGNHFSTHYVVDRYRTRNIDDSLDSYQDLAGGAGDIGDQALPTIPTSEAITIQLKTGLRGRSYNGSVHIWGITDAMVEDNSLIAPAIAEFQTFGTNLLIGLSVGAESWIPAVWSRLLSGDPVATDNQWMTPLTTTVLNLTPGIMRHRRQRTITA